MTDRFNPRHQGKKPNQQPGHVVADPRAAASRQSEGRRHTPAPDVWDGEWIEGRSEIEEACLRMLKGVPGRYPMFGIQMYVETRTGDSGEYAIIVYFDAKYGDEGQNLCRNIPSGFWVGVRELLKDPSKGYKSLKHELLVLALITQPEMRLAISQFREEEAKRHEEEEQRHAQSQKEALQKLRAKVGIQAQIERPASASEIHRIKEMRLVGKYHRPVLSTLQEILIAENGVYDHDGITILVCPGTSGTVIRINKAPEDHEIHFAKRDNLEVYQSALAYEEDFPGDSANYGERDQKRHDMRCYLRAELRKAGVTLHQPVAHSGGNGNIPEEHPPGKAAGADTSEASQAS